MSEQHADVVTYAEALDGLVEAIRVASFEAPRAGSHTEWARRIKGLFEQVGWVGVADGDHEGEWFFHFEDEASDGYTEVRPVFAFNLPHFDGSAS